VATFVGPSTQLTELGKRCYNNNFISSSAFYRHGHTRTKYTLKNVAN